MNQKLFAALGFTLLTTAAAAQQSPDPLWQFGKPEFSWQGHLYNGPPISLTPARAPCMPRPPDLTYGGLPPMHGFQRDHLRPLGLGGTDTPGNVRYQLLPKAHEKDDDEHHAEMMVCDEHLWTPEYALGWLAARWPVDVAHGYLMQSVPQ